MQLIAKPKLITAPTEEVLSLSDLKEFLRIDTTDDNNLLTVVLKAATQKLEDYCDKKFVTQTWDIYFDNLPQYGQRTPWWDGTRDGSINELYNSSGGGLELPFGPLQSVTGVYTYDEDDTEYEFASSNYSADTIGPCPKIGLKIGATWPSTILRPVNGLKVRGVFGYGAGYISSPETASTINADIQEAIKQFAAQIYEHRGDELPKIPPAVGLLLERYRRVKI